ncbi:MAG: Ig-like domain-containing protein [Bacteroidales bacterium]|nr:Ig-like domain-containing protein [Bacteroidales bacterium]
MKPKHIFLSFYISLLSITQFISGQDFPVTVQAESGTLGSDFGIVDVLGVSSVTVNTDNTSNPGNDNRVITYQVTFPDSGTYDLYARILVGPQTYNDDSYFYANSFGIKNPASDADWIRANGLVPVGYTSIFDVVGGSGASASGVWKWINMSEYTGDVPPVTFRVETGALTQTFQIGGRETGFYIDKFVFGRSGLYFTVSNLNRGEPGSELPPSLEPVTDPIAAGQSKFLGSAWDYQQAPFFAGYWNQLTPGNAGKWGSVEYTRDVMNWTVLDSAYNVCRKYHMPLKEHTLIWGAQQPPWIGELDSAAQRQEIEEWFAALAARYDTIEYIDVVNEPIHNAPNGMYSWGATTPNVDYAQALGGAGATGWDWVIEAFRLARQYFPDSKLILNEYSVINSTTTTQQYIGIINLLKAENLIDGIGEQAHAFTTSNTSTATLKSNLDALAATGIPVYLTELDVDGLTDLQQLKEYQRIFPMFWEHPGVEGITLWGYRYPVWRQDQGANLITIDDIERPALTWLKAYVNDTLTLTQSITVSSAGDIDSIFVGDNLQMNALVLPANTTIPNFTWSLAPAGLATIDSDGMLTAAAEGTVTVKATAWDGSDVTGTLDIVISGRLVDSITVYSDGNRDTIFVGETIQMNAQVFPLDATDPSVTWSVEPSGLAQINHNGLVTALDTGNIVIMATANDGSGVSDSVNMAILFRFVESISVSASGNTDTIYIDDTLRMSALVLPENATDPSVTWSVSPPDLAQISQDGLLTALDSGNITVKAAANDGSGVTDSVCIVIENRLVQSITVSLSGSIDTIYVGDTLRLNLLVLPQDATDPSVTWSVAPYDLAQIDQDGLLTAIAAGDIDVEAAANDGSEISGTLNLTIRNRLVQSITISASGNKDSVFVGDTLQLSALVLPSDATIRSFTWSIIPDSLADITAEGLLTASARGDISVIAMADDKSGASDTLEITITEKISNVATNPASENITVYPNPVADGIFSIRGIDDIKEIELIDLIGNKVAVFNNINRHEITLRVKVSPGIYLLRLSDGQHSIYKRIILN